MRFLLKVVKRSRALLIVMLCLFALAYLFDLKHQTLLSSLSLSFGLGALGAVFGNVTIIRREEAAHEQH